MSESVCQSQCVRVGVSESMCQSRCVRVHVSESVRQSRCVGVGFIRVCVSELVCQSRCVRVGVSELVCQSRCVSVGVSESVCQRPKAAQGLWHLDDLKEGSRTIEKPVKIILKLSQNALQDNTFHRSKDGVFSSSGELKRAA